MSCSRTQCSASGESQTTQPFAVKTNTLSLLHWAPKVNFNLFLNPLFLMDFPIHIDTISMALPIEYFKG